MLTARRSGRILSIDHENKLGRWYIYPPTVDGETEAQGGQVPCPHSEEVTKLGFEPRWVQSQSMCSCHSASQKRFQPEKRMCAREKHSTAQKAQASRADGDPGQGLHQGKVTGAWEVGVLLSFNWLPPSEMLFSSLFPLNFPTCPSPTHLLSLNYKLPPLQSLPDFPGRFQSDRSGSAT